MKKMNIYIVDDELFTCKAISRILSAEDYNVIYEVDSVKAFDLISRGFIPDLLITDVKMPEISGLEIVNKFKEFNPGLPVIMMSAHFERDILEKLKNTEKIEFLEKPFGGLDILDCMDKMIL
jgi:DNA-binding NtrC family response regulator